MRRHKAAKVLFALLGWIILTGCSLSNLVNSGERTGAATPGSPELASPTPEMVAPSNPPPDSQITQEIEEPEPFEPLSFSAPDCSYGGAFKSIESTERYTLKFTFCTPEPAFLSKIAFPTLSIQPRQWLESTGGGGEGSLLLTKPIGSGPYKVSEWWPGESLVFSAHEEYWGETKPGAPILVFRWEADPSNRLLQVMSGIVDGADNIGPEHFEQVELLGNLALMVRPPMNVSYLGMVNTLPPFDKEDVRQAIAMAIDRPSLVSNSFPRGYQVADYFSPCSMPYACLGEPWYAFDVEAARSLLADAGYPGGFQSKLYYRGTSYGYLPWPDRVARDIQSQLLQNLNIQLDIQVMDSDSFLAAVDAGQLDGMYLLGWGADFPHASNFLDTHFGPLASRQFGDPYDDILGAISLSSSNLEDTRRSAYQSVNANIRQHAPMVPLAHGSWESQESLAVVYRSDIQGATSGFFGGERFHLITIPGQDTFTWVQDSEPSSLYCPDEIDPQAWSACAQVLDTLFVYDFEGGNVKPLLAEECTADDTLTVWTCRLRQGVTFHDGSKLDANDVVVSLLVQWDASHPLHKGRTGAFAYFQLLWGEFLNAPNE